MTNEDEKALVALSKYRRLTSAQLQRVAYTSYSTAKRRLRILTKAGYLQRLQGPAEHRGVRPYVYSLNSQGQEAVADMLGEPRGQETSSSRTARKLDGHVLHYLAVNDFWISLEEEVRQLPHLQLVGFVPYHYREKKSWSRKAVPVIQDRIPASGPGQRPLLLEPDAAFCVEANFGKLLMLVEIDRNGTILGTKHHSLERKIHNYIYYLHSGVFRELYRRVFLTRADADFTAFSLLTVTTTEARMRKILSAIPQDFEYRKQMFFVTAFERIEQDGVLGSEWLDGVCEKVLFKRQFT